MRRLLVACALGVVAAVPAAPAQAGAGGCVVTEGFPVCAGTCSYGDTLTVYVVGGGSGYASCGGTTVSCLAFRGACTDSSRVSGSGVLQCGGTAPSVTCTVAPGNRSLVA